MSEFDDQFKELNKEFEQLSSQNAVSDEASQPAEEKQSFAEKLQDKKKSLEDKLEKKQAEKTSKEKKQNGSSAAADIWAKLVAWFKKVLTTNTVIGLVLRILILLDIPYAYLMLCGLIFDKWLRLYSAVTFIFWSLMVFYAIAITLVVFTIIWSVRERKVNPPKKSVKKSKK